MRTRTPRQIRRRKRLVMSLIIMSYIVSYFVPLILLYFASKDAFIKTYVAKERMSLAWYGFISVSAIMLTFLTIKVSIKLLHAKASIFKQVFFGIVRVVLVLIIIYIFAKFYQLTLYIESETILFITRSKAFLEGATKALYIFIGCLTFGTICNITAIIIDKEYVKSLNWL